MCGICGTVAVSGLADTEGATLRVQAMLRSLSHRGPDAVGHVASESAVLGVTRLAIRGLQDPNQPLVDSASGIVAVCNGEIDNHQELRRWLAERGRAVRDATDVAVIPGLYLRTRGRVCQQAHRRVRCGVWDPRTRRLTLARDRAGERPLFYAVSDGRESFSLPSSPHLFREVGCPSASIKRPSGNTFKSAFSPRRTLPSSKSRRWPPGS